jgi:2-phospho-L-lactate guanylyltransferase
MKDRLAVVVPMKPLALAKQRLRPAVDDATRITLARAMFEHVLTTIRSSGVADLPLVISADAEVRALAQSYGFWTLDEQGENGKPRTTGPYGEPIGYNEAIIRVVAWTQSQGMTTLLILPADLPHLIPDDLRQLVGLAGSAPRTAVLAPDTAETGTNALLLRPPDLILPAFGPDSFRRHREALRTSGIVPVVYRSASLAYDVDEPADLVPLGVGVKGAERSPEGMVKIDLGQLSSGI